LAVTFLINISPVLIFSRLILRNSANSLQRGRININLTKKIQFNYRLNDFGLRHFIDVTTCSDSLEKMDKECSELMIEIHSLLDLKNTPIKNAVRVLGVTPSQARKLAKGDINKFSVFELQTFLKRLNSANP
jgi:predicted XRE-type DNA-binding protein